MAGQARSYVAPSAPASQIRQRVRQPLTNSWLTMAQNSALPWKKPSSCVWRRSETTLGYEATPTRQTRRILDQPKPIPDYATIVYRVSSDRANAARRKVTGISAGGGTVGTATDDPFQSIATVSNRAVHSDLLMCVHER